MVMARLLRNRLESYVNNVNRAEADYRTQAKGYNTALKAAQSGTPTVMKDADGKYVVVGGTYEDQLKLISSNIVDASDLGTANEMTYGIMGGLPKYGRDADGNVAKYAIQPYTQTVAPQPSGDPILDLINPPKETTVSGYRWVKEGGNLAMMPDTPEVDVPQQPNLTQSNIKELQNPSYDPAGVVAQGNYGINAKSQLAGDVANSRISAFADPEDPNDIASRGILARTLAGQLG